MYVCLCHGFTDTEVRAAAAAGCCTPGAVYRTICGEGARCCKCVPEVRALLREAQLGGADAFMDAAE
jgi:bacterioferritin-associated ferredoxin